MNDDLRPITPGDDEAIAAIIRPVMPEFGASGPGFAITDPEVDGMSTAYARLGCAYFVVVRDGRVLGGGGVAPLDSGPQGVCELRKMYFLPALRGSGTGRRLLETCLHSARALGYHTCYLETLTGMAAARRLYERSGFEALDGPMGDTGHFGCNAWYARGL